MDRQDPKIGRTHRMVEEALKLARDGYTVTLIGLFNDGEDKLRRLANALAQKPSDLNGLIITKFRGVWELENLLASNINSDKLKFLVDHDVIEHHCKHSLEMLKRYEE